MHERGMLWKQTPHRLHSLYYFTDLTQKSLVLEVELY